MSAATHALSDTRLDALASRLREAQRTRTPIAALTAEEPDLRVEDAYAISRRNLQARLAGGARLVGHKIGITSPAVQAWLKVNEPDFGFLLDDMWVPDGTSVSRDDLLQPRVEGEIAFVLSRDLDGPGVTIADVLRATDYLLPCIEVIDSRIRDWSFAYADTIADNASSGLFVLGHTPISPRGLDLSLCGMALRKRGQVMSTGVGVACLTHPAHAVAWLANKLGSMERDRPALPAGSVVLSGALGPVAPVEAGDEVEVEIAHVGSARVRFSRGAALAR